MSNKIKNIICFLADRRFFWSIMLVYVFIKLLPIVAFDKRFTYAVIIISFLILIIRIIKLIIYDKKFIVNKYRIITILFIAICILSVFYNIGFNISNLNIKNSEYRVLVVLIVNLLIVFSFETNTNDGYEKDIKYLDTISFIISLFSFFNILLSIYDTIINKRDRIWGLTGSVWSFTHFVAISFAINLYLLIKESRWSFKNFYIINLVLHFITLIFTQQRAGYLCVLVGFLLSVLLIFINGQIREFIKYLTKNKRILLLIFVIMIIFIILLNHYINLKVILNKFLKLSTSGRITIINISLNSLFEKNSLLFGLIGNLHNLNLGTEYKKIQFLTTEGSFHNIYICVIMFFGLIALILFMLFIIMIAKKFVNLIKIVKINKDIYDLLILSSFGIFGSLVSGLFDDNMLINLPYLPNLMFLILSSILCSIDEKRLENVK